MEQFYIHFEKDDHHLTADEFVQTINSLKTVYYNLSYDIIETKTPSKLLILPPEEGSFLAEFGILLTPAAIIGFLETDMGKAFIKGLTGNEPAYYLEKTGQLIRDLIIALYTKSKEEILKLIEDLQEINPKIIKLDASIKAQSDFYNMCLSNKDIKGIGFNKLEEFPVQRQDFWKRLSDDIIRPLPSDIIVQELIIVKPVTVESRAKWYLKDNSTGKGDNYSILDDNFKKKILDGDNPLKETELDDKIIATVEYVKELKNGVEKNTAINVVEVHFFNNEELAPIPDGVEFNKKMKKEDLTGQVSLFDQSNWNELTFASEENGGSNA